MPSKKPRIQLYADECFPVPSATYLKSLGYSVVHAYDRNYIKRSDYFHFSVSKKLNRTLITLDRDFIKYGKLNVENSLGIIIISTGTATYLSVNKVCNKLLKLISEDFVKNSLIKVTIDKIIKIKNGKVVMEKKL
ncbi:MAG: DUF5615 family PIN-like protein [Patescibacteria group bacterium]|nr:DUF5615 family PIN-like protein [Patescibacteria group bacterium]